MQVLDDINRRLAAEEVSPRIIEQLKHLNDLLTLIDHQAVSEQDLNRIESCANQLLGELGVLFDHQGIGSLYDEPLH